MHDNRKRCKIITKGCKRTAEEMMSAKEREAATADVAASGRRSLLFRGAVSQCRRGGGVLNAWTQGPTVS